MEPLITNEISLWMAFLYGVVAFLNPCIVPIIPFFFEILTRKKPIRSMILFSIGFILTFSAAGVAFACFASLVERMILTKFMGIVIILLSVLYILSFKFPGWRLLKVAAEWEGSSLLFGVVLALAWIPCSSPVIACALTLISAGGILKGALTMLFFSLGIVTPFLVLGKWISDLLSKIPPQTLRLVIGVSMIAAGIYFIMM